MINPTEQNAKGAAVGIYLFIVFFAFTILPLPWIYPPEINPLRTRTTASAVSTCTNWLTNFAVVMFTPPFISASGWGCYLYFAVMNFLFVPIIFFFYPETAGRSLEEIDIIFAKAYVEKDNHGELLLLYQNYHYKKLKMNLKAWVFMMMILKKIISKLKKMFLMVLLQTVMVFLKNQKMFKSKGLFLL